MSTKIGSTCDFGCNNYRRLNTYVCGVALFIKAPLTIVRAPLRIAAVHLFVRSFVCLTVAYPTKMRTHKRDFLKY